MNKSNRALVGQTHLKIFPQWLLNAGSRKGRKEIPAKHRRDNLIFLCGNFDLCGLSLNCIS